MNRTLSLMLILRLLCTLAACGNASQAGSPQPSQSAASSAEPPDSTETIPQTMDASISAPASDGPAPEAALEAPAEFDPESAPSPAGSGILAAYFTYGENASLDEDVDASSSASIQYWDGRLTGNTGVAAAQIAQATGGSGFSGAIDKIRAAGPDAYVLEGFSVSGSRAAGAAGDVSEWLSSLELPA